MRDLIKINGKAYAFNLPKICEFISKMAGKSVKETEILDTYDFEESKKSIASKTVRELNTTGNGQDAIVYDLVKTVIIQVIAFDEVGEVDFEELQVFDGVKDYPARVRCASIASQALLNTLKKEENA